MTDFIAVNSINKNLYFDCFYSMIFATICTGLSYWIGYEFGWISGTFPWVDVVAVWTSYACTWMCVTQNYIAFPLGLISVVLYALSFWHSHLISSSISQWYLVPTQFVGWWYWMTGKKLFNDKSAWLTENVPVTRIKFNKNLIFYVVISIIAWLVTWFITLQFHAAMAPFDSAILIISIFAQNLMQGKKLESWGLWIILNIIAIYVYFSTNLFLFGVQYIFFIMTDITGFISWLKDYRRTIRE